MHSIQANLEDPPVAEHRKAMEARAKEKGVVAPAGPRSDMCERMKQRGRIS